MPDPVLRSRVLALEHQLDLIAQSPQWLEKMELRSDEVTDELETELDATIGRQARKQKDVLRAIADSLDAAARDDDETEPAFAEQWRRYQRVRDASEEVFSECLEFFGGLAIRKNGWDERICKVADELIRTCARETTGDPWISCTVPAPHEALAKTLARMVRLRFPDWSVWTLPFTAHEYGHVALVEAPDLAKFVTCEVENSVLLALPDIVSFRASAVARDRKTDDVAPLYEELETVAREQLDACLRDPDSLDDVAAAANGTPPTIAGEPAPEPIRLLTLRVRETVRRERVRMHVLIADAFATYTMGPAYACAALMLRFTPAHRDDAVWDTERAAVVLAMLRRMNAEGAGLYERVTEELATTWNQAVLRARAPAKLEAAAEKAVEGLVGDAWNVFRVDLRPSARYPEGEPNEGWLSAQMLAAQWSKNLQDRRALTTAAPLNKLRDVINAAWWCRLTRDADDAEAIEIAAVAVCRDILDQREPLKTERSSQRPFE